MASVCPILAFLWHFPISVHYFVKTSYFGYYGRSTPYPLLLSFQKRHSSWNKTLFCTSLSVFAVSRAFLQYAFINSLKAVLSISVSRSDSSHVAKKSYAFIFLFAVSTSISPCSKRFYIRLPSFRILSSLHPLSFILLHIFIQ